MLFEICLTEHKCVLYIFFSFEIMVQYSLYAVAWLPSMLFHRGTGDNIEVYNSAENQLIDNNFDDNILK